jgi:hypothetical protein
MNKTIYMTYKRNIPDIVFDRWKNLNPEYDITLSLDNDCIQFLSENFNDYIAELFKKIPIGMYKADLWRLCKLYINGGIYADIDLVPYINIDTLDKDITFYSCIALDKKSIFQAFLVTFHKPKNPLILNFLISFLLNNPYTYLNGPCYDMYNCIKHNLNNIQLLPETKYEMTEIKIKINIGSSNTNNKIIDLHYFPNDINYIIKLHKNQYKELFSFCIENNILSITRLDVDSGWEHNHYIDICIESKQSIFLFPEKTIDNTMFTCYVSYNNNKILDCRDLNYYNNHKRNGW